MRFKGRITQWKDDKGFGFLAPSEGGAQVFVHIKDFHRRGRRPNVDEFVTYELVEGRDGRTHTANVEFSDDRTQYIASNEGRTFAPVVAAIFLAIIAALVATSQLPVVVLAIYLVASGSAFIVYAWDKASAKSGRQRTPENTLLMLGLVGGWPGALVAQKVLRHKSSKRPFMAAFWVTVLLNCGALLLFLTPAGAALFN